MNKTIIYSINDYLIRAVEASYLKAKKDVVKNIRKYIVSGKTSQMVTGKSFNEKIFDDKNFSDKLPAYLSIDYNATDEKFLDNFRKEVFTVACVGTYDLEEKMKEVARSILELPESDTRDRKKLFVRESQDLLDQYLPDGDKIPPAGWLKTNLQTAVNSSYNASQWVKLQDPAVKDLYPAYKYKTREDSHVRQEHAILNNAVYRSDDIIWKKIYPPNGWNCRCYINYLSSEDIQEPGNKPNELTIDPAEVSRLVKEAKIPPDFQRNSGMDGHINQKWLSAKLKDMPEEVVKEVKVIVKEYAESVDSGGANISDSDPGLREFYDPVKRYDKDIYNSLKTKPFEYYIPLSDAVTTEGHIIKFGVKAFTSELRIDYLHNHELDHVFYYDHNLVTDIHVDKRIVLLENGAIDIFRSNKNELIELFDFNRRFEFIKEIQKNNPSLKKTDIQFLLSNTADYINAITKGKYGWGHDLSYWSLPNTPIKEFSVHSTEMAKNKNFLQDLYLAKFKEITIEFKKIVEEFTNVKK